MLVIPPMKTRPDIMTMDPPVVGETIYNTVFETADQCLREARAFLDEPGTPDSERWEVITFLDSEAGDEDYFEDEKEQQKYAERVRPYIIDKLDHSWPDHLRRLDAGGDESDGSWLLGRTLAVCPEMIRHPRAYAVRKKFFLHRNFASYTGLILAQVEPEQLEELIARVTERHFDDEEVLDVSDITSF
jgi:hypothetical protein